MMEARTREVLDMLDEVLMGDVQVAQEVWDVLTALRGPDSDNNKVKRKTTWVIRAAAFPKTVKFFYQQLPARFELDRLDFSTVGLDMTSHFADHVTWAACILGLAQKPPND